MEEMTRAAQTRQKLSPEDRSFVSWLHMACGGDGKLMEGGMAANLNNIQWLSRWPWGRASVKKGGNDDGEWDGEFEAQMVVMGTALQNVLNV